MNVEIIENIESVLPLFQLSNFDTVSIPNTQRVNISKIHVPCEDNLTDISFKTKAFREGRVCDSAGESPFHKAFKEYISRNPPILGLPESIGPGEIELYLPSGDIADVLFIQGKEWIIAEVKSKISDTADIYRGLYQCVKYQAVAKAFQSEKGLQPNCRVVLVLESEFPDELIELRNFLGIEVVSKVSIKSKNA
jgi:hypothetical protein